MSDEARETSLPSAVVRALNSPGGHALKEQILASYHAGVVEGIQQGLRESAADFRDAAAAGIEPALNLTAARLLDQRADRIKAGATHLPALTT